MNEVLPAASLQPARCAALRCTHSCPVQCAQAVRLSRFILLCVARPGRIANAAKKEEHANEKYRDGGES